MTPDTLAAAQSAASPPQGAHRIAAWQAQHAEAWDAVARAWRKSGGRHLVLTADAASATATATGCAVPVMVEGETAAWLVGESPDAAGAVWLQSVAALIGDAAARDAELDTMTDELVDTYDQLTFLYETARTFSVADTLADALQQVLAQARRIVGAEGCVLTVVQRSAPGTAFAPVALVVPIVLTDGVVPAPALALAAHAAAIREGYALVANSASEVREVLRVEAWDDAIHVSNMIVAAIHGPEGTASAACFGASRPIGFTAGNRRLMQAVVEQCISIVARFTLQEEQIRRSRLARDLELAVEMQTALLPAPFAGVPGARLAVRILPANEVGGDFYVHPDGGTAPHDDNRAFVVGVGDVAGKGIAAAMVVTMCLSALRTEMRHFASPAAALGAVGTFIAGELERVGSFVTCTVASYDIATRTLHYASAGHTPALHWHAATGAITLLTATGLPLGVDVGIGIADTTVPFLPGDVLLLTTDGVTEAMDAASEQFGVERLRAVLTEGATAPPEAIAAAVVAAVRAFAPTQRDDITVMALRAEATS